MLKKNTVFVIGAGASKEFGLPVGTELAGAISEKLDVRFDDFGQKMVSGDHDLFRNVSNGKDPRVTQQAGWLAAAIAVQLGAIQMTSFRSFLIVGWVRVFEFLACPKTD